MKWSPNGERLLTRTKTHIMIWSFTGKNGLTLKIENKVEIGKGLVDLEWIDNNSESLQRHAKA